MRKWIRPLLFGEILLGRYPAGENETATELVPVPPAIPVGLPSELLERRPGLAVLNAFEEVEAAPTNSDLLDIKNQRLAERVNLHLALGGSFESAGEDEGE